MSFLIAGSTQSRVDYNVATTGCKRECCESRKNYADNPCSKAKGCLTVNQQPSPQGKVQRLKEAVA
jgi:hypothetical protein